MGGKFTILENRTFYNIELRMWIHPARPDKFEKIIRIKPGRSIRIKAKQGLLDFEKVLVMVYANGVWTGKYIFPLHLMTYAKVICDRNQQGRVTIRGKRAYFNFCRLKFFPNSLLLFQMLVEVFILLGRNVSALLIFMSEFYRCFAFIPAKYVGLGMVEEEI